MDNGRDYLTKYLGKAEPFATLGYSQRTHPVAWWNAAKSMGVDFDLCTLGQRLMAAAPSTASIERAFNCAIFLCHSNCKKVHRRSRLRLTYGMLRCRLKVAKATKLAFVFSVLNEEQAVAIVNEELSSNEE